ncbi:flavin reductase [Thiocapsa imhoffii]|uniref:Flavin reductase n=1 Tax=Thiocapsa imhoffii TaxID=382777 RepID=A0A9X0WG84_9GAMM|nr:flavin reductase family protein [Thiocapsa imhoffii]MBK1643930.1 flavin reductase [Thiocapsa imhoffii]
MTTQPPGLGSGQEQLPAATESVVNAIFHRYDPPLWLVTACADGRRGGFIATSVTRVSIVPELPRILLAVAKHHFTWDLIERSDRFALHLLPCDAVDLVHRFGLASGHAGDKFADLPHDTTPAGMPLIKAASSWLDCAIESRMDIGDRTTYLAAVTGGGQLRDGPVMTVAELLSALSHSDHAKLKRLYAHDQTIDREAILAWRNQRGISSHAV